MYSHHRSDSIFNYFRNSAARASTENDRDSYQMQLLEKLDADEFLSTSFLISFTHGSVVANSHCASHIACTFDSQIDDIFDGFVNHRHSDTERITFRFLWSIFTT